MPFTVRAAAGPLLLCGAALLPAARPVAALALLVAWVGQRARGRAEAVALAATLPVGLILPWPWILGVDAPIGVPACTAPLSAIVVRRLALAAFGLTAVATVAGLHGLDRGELGLRGPAPREAAGAAAAAGVVALGGLVAGPWLASPFFGELDFPRPAAALLPALLFGVANGVLEEVAYRGAMQGLLAHAMPLSWAIGIQGLVFGIVHAGPEVLALLPVHVALMGAIGIAGGVARARLGSLWLPIGVHVGADIALYVGLACRAAAA